MPRAESQLPRIFYQCIENVPGISWCKYIRLLGNTENDITNATSNHRGLQERKYQMLNRWKMYIGVLNDNQIEEILNKTLEELNGGSEYTCHHFPSHLQKNVRKARLIYKFIEKYETEAWPQVARTSLNIDDLTRFRSSYSDEWEQRYQTVLQWERSEKIDEQTFVTTLNGLIGRPL